MWIPGLLETSQGCTNLVCAGSTRALEEHLSHQLQNWKLANGLPRWRSDKRQCRRYGFDSWVGKKPSRRKWQHTPIFLPGKFHGWGAWWTTVYGVTKHRTQLSDWVCKFANNKGFKHISWRWFFFKFSTIQSDATCLTQIKHARWGFSPVLGGICTNASDHKEHTLARLKGWVTRCWFHGRSKCSGVGQSWRSMTIPQLTGCLTSGKLLHQHKPQLYHLWKWLISTLPL